MLKLRCHTIMPLFKISSSVGVLNRMVATGNYSAMNVAEATSAHGRTKRKRQGFHDNASGSGVEIETSEQSVVEDDDVDLMAAAEAWAASSAEQDKESTKVFSFHVTQLDFEATAMDLRHHFGSAGCAINSIRLVYDRENGTRTFRGVAFIDVADEPSCKIAQSLHKTKILSRKINVRPVKSKSELAEIVKTTAAKVAGVIKETKMKKQGTKGESKIKRNAEKRENMAMKDGSKSAGKKQRKDGAQGARQTSDTDNIKDGKKKTINREKAFTSDDKKGLESHAKRTQTTPTQGSKKPVKVGPTSKKPKLTKKQRNRRAAILASKRR